MQFRNRQYWLPQEQSNTPMERKQDLEKLIAPAEVKLSVMATWTKCYNGTLIQKIKIQMAFDTSTNKDLQFLLVKVVFISFQCEYI